MIKTLHLKNYQSHANTRLEFSDINVIVGPTDSGKSAIVRALAKVATNKPLGLSFIRNGTKKCSIGVKIDDNTLIRRNLSSTVNTYTVDGIELGVPRTGVPDEVQDVLRLSDLNLQFQLDSPFLLSMRPGALSQYINKIVNLEKIDSALSTINTKESRTKRRLSQLTTEIEEQEKHVERLRPIDKLQEETDKLFSLWEKLDEKSIRIQHLSRLLVEGQEVKKQIDTYSSFVPGFASTISSLLDEQEIVEAGHEEIKHLGKKVQDAKNVIQRIVSYTDLDNMQADCVVLCPLSVRFEADCEKIERLLFCIDRIKDLDEREKSTAVNIRRKTEKFNQLIGDICPLCGQGVK
jgi:DNA repair protein SbcC/Rad50